MMACAIASCDRLALDNGDRVLGTQFLVCKYTPTYFSREDGQLYRPGPCSSSGCSTDARSCVSFGGAVGGVAGGDGGDGLYCGKGIRFRTVKGWLSDKQNSP